MPKERINRRTTMAKHLTLSFTAALLAIAALIWLRSASGGDQAARGSAQSAPGAVKSQQAPALTDEESSESNAHVPQMIRNEIARDLREADKDVLARANETQERADHLQSLVVWVSTGWLAVITIVFASVIFFGWQDGSIRARLKTADDAANQASKSAEKVKFLEEGVQKASRRIAASDGAVASSLDKIVGEIPRLVELMSVLLERGLVVGDAPNLPPLEVIAEFEEADILIVVADSNDSVEKNKLSEPFTALGYYGQLVENYPRAIARFFRAIALDPSSLSAHRGLCGALYNLAARQTRPIAKNQLLDLAENTCNKSIELSPTDAGAFYDLGWIKDERNDFEAAVAAYQQSRKLDVKNKVPNATYNLACTLSRWGGPHLEEAIEELEKVIKIDANRARAARDQDFKNLRADPELGPRFEALIRENEQMPR